MSKEQDLLIRKIKGVMGGRTKMVHNWSPKWLVNPNTNCTMEIDIYLPKYAVGFEYQGYYHFGGANHNADRTRQKDIIKPGIAKKHGVHIVELFPQDLDEKPFIDIFLFRVKTQCPEKHYVKIAGQVDRMRNISRAKPIIKIREL